MRLHQARDPKAPGDEDNVVPLVAANRLRIWQKRVKLGIVRGVLAPLRGMVVDQVNINSHAAPLSVEARPALVAAATVVDGNDLLRGSQTCTPRRFVLWCVLWVSPCFAGALTPPFAHFDIGLQNPCPKS